MIYRMVPSTLACSLMIHCSSCIAYLAEQPLSMAVHSESLIRVNDCAIGYQIAYGYSNLLPTSRGYWPRKRSNRLRL